MKKRSTKLQNKVKVKVAVSQRLRMVAAAGALAVGVFSAALIFNIVGDSKQSNAHNNSEKQVETLPDFKWRIPLEVDQAKLSEETLYNFPLMVSITNPDLRSVAHGGKVVSNEGNDIYFTSSDGISVLDFEVEKYNPQTGECLAWVRMDSLNKKTSNQIFLYFSNKNAANATTRDAWSNSYKGVWHLKGLLSAKNPHSNAFAEAKPANAKENRDLYIPAERNSSRFMCMNSPEDVNITSDLSLSAWVYFDNVKDDQVIVTNQLEKQGGYALKLKDKQLNLSICNDKGEVAEIPADVAGTKLEKGQWYHVAATYSDFKDSVILYVNGEVSRQYSTTQQLAQSNGFFQIGRDPNNKQYYFDGSVVEVHVSNVYLPRMWLTAEYQSQARPNEFIKVGKVEQVFQMISSTLLGFEADQMKNSIVLKWITSNEEELDKFTIERSLDGVNYDPIANKTAAGNSAEILKYQFRDEKPTKGYSYYRLRITNNMGNDEFSMVTPVKFEPESANLLTIESAGPNPFQSDFKIDYIAPKGGKLKVKLQNITKEVVMEKEINCEGKKLESFSFNDSQKLNPGIYFVTFQQGDDTKMVKLVKKA
jgi:hypothetical protein